MRKLYTKARRAHRYRFYANRAWRKRAEYQKKKNPLCAHCLQEGKLTPARVADHCDPTWETGAQFIKGKLQSLCAFHDNIKRHFDDIPLLRRAEKTRMEFWDD